MKSPVFRSFFLSLAVLVGLLLLGFLPNWGIGGWESKPVDLLADLAPCDSSTDTAAVVDVPISRDSCKAGVTCLAEYAHDTAANMAYFYAALTQVAKRPVRIAFLGDSFVEADILTDALRDMMQQHFGGLGPGYVGLNHIAVASRKTIRQQRGGFEMHSAVDEQYEATLPDLGGYYFIPQEQPFVELSGNADYSPRLARAEVSQFLLLTRGTPVTLTATTESGKTQHFTIPGDYGLHAATFNAPMQRVRWTISEESNAVCYATTLDANTGVAVDNLSLRGSTGLTITAIPQDYLRRLDDLRHYDLVVLQYGLNVLQRGKRNYRSYTQQVVRMINHLRAAMPTTAFLVVGLADHDAKLPDGSIGTLPELMPLIEAQATAAAQAGVAFWNTFEAMGGKDSMLQFVTATPPKAARDYTHINEQGGQHIARQLFNALNWGFEQWKQNNTQ